MTTSFPIGLFCQATISGPLPPLAAENAPPPAEAQPAEKPKEQEPETMIGLDGSDEDNHWDHEVV